MKKPIDELIEEIRRIRIMILKIMQKLDMPIDQELKDDFKDYLFPKELV